MRAIRGGAEVRRKIVKRQLYLRTIALFGLSISHPLTSAHRIPLSSPLPRRSALYDKVLPRHLVPRVVAHPSLHLCIMVAQILPPFDQLPDWKLKAMFWMFLVRGNMPPGGGI